MFILNSAKNNFTLELLIFVISTYGDKSAMFFLLAFFFLNLHVLVFTMFSLVLDVEIGFQFYEIKI